MSFKTLFDKATAVTALANKNSKQIGGEVESRQYHTQDIIHEKRFIPRIDYSDPKNFARYGSAEEYYAQSIGRILDNYPYDGSLKERIQWENESTYVDLHILDNLYPRTNGFVHLSQGGWGTRNGGESSDGYGLPNTLEYIYLEGGPHGNPTGPTPYAQQFTGSNYYDPDTNRESNLKFDLQNQGATIEFWLKKDAWADTLTTNEVIFDMEASNTGTEQNRFRVALDYDGEGASPFLITALSGGTGITDASLGSSVTIADGLWHHYAVTLKSVAAGIQTKLYIDGGLNVSSVLGSSGINDVGGALVATVGSLVAATAGGGAQYAGKLSGSLDELRYWKTRRTGEKIGRYWFDQVGGGTNTDPEAFTDTQEEVNTTLGVYYKFNEGITGDTSIDSTVLDYSGRVSNGTWTGYTTESRATGSAIVISKAAIKEFKDPIIYGQHPDVIMLQNSLQVTGSNHDTENAAMVYKSIPGWITEDDEETTGNLKKLTQIMGSYFDTLQLQTESLNLLKDVEYVSGSNKPIPFANRLLNSHGLVAPEIFLDADILEKLADRSEDKLYEKTLNDLKNIIYQNIYNNLTYIYKSKGTEKSFRNLIRCFGIDDELIKLKLYAKNTQYEFRENRRTLILPTKYVNFNATTATEATVFGFKDPSGSYENTTGYLTSSVELTGGFAYTFETDVFFPEKKDITNPAYADTNTLSASLFGIHGTIGSETDTAWPEVAGSVVDDKVNFQVYACRDELDSRNVKFVLTGTQGGLVPLMESSLYEDTYSDVTWNLSVRVKPERYPLAAFSTGADTGAYTIELHGIKVQAGEVTERFNISDTITAASNPDGGFMTGSKRPYVGAHRTNFTGTVLQSTDVRIEASRFWVNYVEDEALRAHALDSENHGAFQPHQYAYPFASDGHYGDVVEFDTLAFNWEFSQNTGSNALGQMVVADESSGSNVTAAYQGLGELLNKQYTALGYGFPQSSTEPIVKDFVVISRLNDVETIGPAETINVLSAQDQHVFKIDSRPINYYFSFEKSMYNTISEEMVNYFGTLKDFNTLVGAPVNRYRPDYKQLAFLKQKFFENVANDEIDFDKFYELYKWFDSTLSFMLGQLVPASADFADNIRTMVESHALERNKYNNILPFVDKENTVFEATVSSSVDYGDAISSPDDEPQGTGFYPAHAPTKRATGLSNRGMVKKWKYVHAPVSDDPTEKYLWWKNKAERNTPAIDVPAGVLTSRAQILRSIRMADQREEGKPYRFNVAGSYDLQGVGTGYNFKPYMLYPSIAPFGGNAAGTNAPRDIAFISGSTVEALLNTTDEFYPTYKQRLGFAVDLDKNKNDSAADPEPGGHIAPFSLYNATLTNTPSSFRPNTAITNLHHDYVADNSIPAQGPFTEKYVGGRRFRHVELNTGADTALTRPEGFKLQFSEVSSSTGGKFSGSLAILPPNSTGLITRAEIPTAQRLRDETAKRPVNIKNIFMTTASAGERLSNIATHGKIGNYQKNYQVIQTSGRSQNDPYFVEQSFNFALNPQNPYPRSTFNNRFPLQNPLSATQASGETLRVANTKAIVLWDGPNIHYQFTAPAGLNSNEAETIAFWVKADSSDLGGYIIYNADGGTRRLVTIEATGQVAFLVGLASGNHTWATTNPVTSGDEWIHVAISYDASSDATTPNIYVNGTAVAIYESGTPGSGDPDDWSSTVLVGNTTSVNFQGYISDMAFWNTALDAPTIASLYARSTANLINASWVASPLMWYRCGNGATDTAATIVDQMGTANLTSTSGLKEIVDIPPGSCLGTSLDNFALPNRDGINSNQTVFVNHFSAPGGYKTLSRGYLDPAHEELSVYNALPYRNRGVIDYGLSGSASADPSIAQAEHVVGQLLRDRGLNQRASLHCGQYGIDAAYGSITAQSTRVDGGTGYSSTPSWHKTNRNTLRRMESGSTGYAAASTYDNLYVQHQIPQSAQQYAWITASLAPGESIMVLQPPTCISASSLTQLLTASAVGYSRYWSYNSALMYGATGRGGFNASSQGLQFLPVDFLGLSTIVVDPVSASTHTLGYSLDLPLYTKLTTYYAKSDYINPSTMPPQAAAAHGNIITNLANGAPGHASILNSILLNRNGPYGYPTWKQIRTGETLVARTLRRQNKIGTVKVPPVVKNVVASTGVELGFVRAKQPVGFVDFVEQPLSSRYSPIFVATEDNTANSNVRNNIQLNVAYGNRFDNFSNEGLNNLLNIPPPDIYNNPFTNIADSIVRSQLSTMMIYSERIYPAEINAYKNIVRNRTTFTISNVWNADRGVRSATQTRSNSQGDIVDYQSIWALDPQLNFSTVAPALSNITDGSGELQNMYNRFGVQSTGYTDGSITASAIYASRVPVGYSEGATSSANLVYGGAASFITPTSAGKMPYERYEDWVQHLRLIGKDYSIVPEFRLSELMETYLETYDGNFLAEVTGALTLTGSSAEISNNQEQFYKTYTNADFMKYFEVVDNMLDNQRSGDLKIQREKLALRCTALLKFLPYKGFYPSERILELASLFSSSYGDNFEAIAAAADGSTTANPTAYRAIVEPLFAPGIWFNSVKSGVGVGSWVTVNTAPDSVSSQDDISRSGQQKDAGITVLPEGSVCYGQGSLFSASLYRNVNTYHLERVPFEASYRPEEFLSQKSVTGSYIWDSGMGTASLAFNNGNKYTKNRVKWNGAGKDLYRLAADNFLCETTNFFMDDMVSFISSPENQFSEKTQEGEVFALTLNFNRPMTRQLGTTAGGDPDRTRFELYNRASAFGSPFILDDGYPMTTTGDAASGSIELTSSLVSSGIQAQGYIELTGAMVGGVAASGNIKVDSWADNVTGQGIRLYNAEGTEYYTYTFSSTSPTSADTINTSNSNSKQLLEIQSAVELSAWDGTTRVNTVDNTVLELTQSATGTAGNTAIGEDGGGLSPTDFINGANATGWSITTGDRWTISDGGTNSYNYLQPGTVRTATFAATSSGDPCAYDGCFEIVNTGDANADILATIQSFYDTVNTYQAANPDYKVTSSTISTAESDERVGVVYFRNCHTGAYGNVGIIATTSSNGDYYQRVAGMGSATGVGPGAQQRAPSVAGVDPVYTLADQDRFVISDGACDGATTWIPFYLTGAVSGSTAWNSAVASTPFAELTASDAQSTATNLVNAINAMANYGTFPMTAQLAAGGSPSAANARIDIVNDDDGACGNQAITSVLSSEASGYINILGLAGGKDSFDTTEYTASLAPNLPSYFYGTSSVTIITSASYGGRQTIGELFGNAEYIYDRSYETGDFDTAAVGYWFAQQVSESVNLNEVFAEGRSFRWAIQSKFETPVLNFADISPPLPAAALYPVKAGCDADITSKGMWHQYGTDFSKGDGIYLNITTPKLVDSTRYGTVHNPSSLAQMVGFEEGVNKEIGQVRSNQALEEAVVAVPFVIKANRRQFISFPRKRPASYARLEAAMDKYVFPPKFDFLQFDSVKPIIMYVFEFSMDLKKKDLTDMWQNLAPGGTTPKMAVDEVIIEDKKLINKMLTDNENLQWMVFKVKRRATKDFEIQRRLQLVDSTNQITPSIGYYTYNWPYDYFSLVELVKMDESVQYASTDIIVADGEPIATAEAASGRTRLSTSISAREITVGATGTPIAGVTEGSFEAASAIVPINLVDPDTVGDQKSETKIERTTKTTVKKSSVKSVKKQKRSYNTKSRSKK